MQQMPHFIIVFATEAQIQSIAAEI